MTEVDPQSPTASNREVADGTSRVSMDHSNGIRYDEAPRPAPPASVAVQAPPQTTVDASELRERVASVLHSDVSVWTLQELPL